jgi:hypothetical protein
MKLIEFLRRLGMSELQGKVKEIFKGQIASGRNAGESFWSITLDDADETKITCFSKEEEKGWIEGLQQNQEYTFTVKVSGDYINIAGQTVPCIQQGGDQGGDMREEPLEGEDDGKGSVHQETKKPVKVAQRRKPPVTTSTAGSERVYKNKISALSLAVEYICATDPTVKETELMECADRFLTWIMGG